MVAFDKKMTDRTQQEEKSEKRVAKKKSEYGRQLEEKQRVKEMYGMRERQFKRFYSIAIKSKGATGELLLSMLESRLDNAIYRLKFAPSRAGARQMVVHGHVKVNGKKVYSPSYLLAPNDVISLDERVNQKAAFLEQVVDKRLKMGIKVPEWLELDKKDRTGKVLRSPVRTDIQVPIEEHLIVELYSK